MLGEILFYIAAGFFEILGCFMFWEYFKNDKPTWYLGVGIISLILFASVLTRVESEFAGRAYAAYGGIYIICSLLWLNFVEKQAFTRYDLLGSLVALIGAIIIIYPNLLKT
ncbi:MULTISPECIES: YnfA family protein [unclassified Campylobacter]|uniref:YnfA family protein n=1 Tax=unclassified Campylobacter TaxID=2593542 RepID=UPI003D32F916